MGVSAKDLVLAAEAGRVDGVVAALTAGVDVNSRDPNGSTGLHFAAANGHLPVVAILLKHHANVNVVNRFGETPLVFASLTGREDVVESLLTAGADPNLRTPDGKGPLVAAIIGGGHEGIVRRLLAKGADASVPCKGVLPLGFAQSTGHSRIADLLQAAMPTATDDDLFGAILKGDMPALDDALARGANVNARGPGKMTPLFFAVQAGNADAARRLLDKGADVDARNESGITPLLFASFGGQAEVARLLLNRGADTSVRFGGESAEQVATRRGHSEVVRLLRQHDGR